MILRVIGALVSLVVLASASAWVTAQSRSSVLEGVWAVQEVSYPTPPTNNPINNPTGFVFFSGQYFSSIILRNSDRPGFAQGGAATATADQLRAVWGPLQATAGTFEVAGSTLTMRPTVSRNPVLMGSGSVLEYSFTLDGDTLTLTTVRVNDRTTGSLRTEQLMRVQ